MPTINHFIDVIGAIECLDVSVALDDPVFAGAASALRLLVAKCSPSWGKAPCAHELADRILSVQGIWRDKVASTEGLQIAAAVLG